MSKSIRTIYRNGQIELPPEVQLPDNTYVTVILPDDLPEDAAPDPAFSIPDLAQDIGPEDLSRNLERGCPATLREHGISADDDRDDTRAG